MCRQGSLAARQLQRRFAQPPADATLLLRADATASWAVPCTCTLGGLALCSPSRGGGGGPQSLGSWHIFTRRERLRRLPKASQRMGSPT